MPVQAQVGPPAEPDTTLPAAPEPAPEEPKPEGLSTISWVLIGGASVLLVGAVATALAK